MHPPSIQQSLWAGFAAQAAGWLACSIALMPALCLAQAAGSGTVSAADLKQQEAYLSDFGQQAADVTHHGSQSVRRVMNHRPFVTPKGWRLVSVLPASAHGVDAQRGQEFVLFFQDQASGDVHTVGMNSEGAVTGRNLLRMRQQR